MTTDLTSVGCCIYFWKTFDEIKYWLVYKSIETNQNYVKYNANTMEGGVMGSRSSAATRKDSS